jgi:hypothetical protein
MKIKSTHLIFALGLWATLSAGLILAVAVFSTGPRTRAVMLMATGLAVFWIVTGGLLMRRFRDPVRAMVQNIRMDWRVKFVVFATLLALLEEAVTVSMTNLAPLFGVPVGAAYITASANYLDVVCLHSVVVFIPMFIGWAWLLNRYDFSPNVVFLLFGLTGTLAEVSFGGAQQLGQLGFWVFVYGLMVYLPAYSLPAGRAVKKPMWWHYPLAVALPIVFAMPVAGVVSFLHPYRLHFPEIPPNS